MQNQPKAKNGYVCMGVIAGAHGLQGEIKVKTFTEKPQNITEYGPLVSYNGRAFSLSKPRISGKGLVIVKVAELNSRNDSEAVKGEFLYIEREKLPAPKQEETYYADLINLPVKYENGSLLGKIINVFSTGANHVLEVESIGKKITLLPFVNQVVLEVKKDCVIVSKQAEEFENL